MNRSQIIFDERLDSVKNTSMVNCLTLMLGNIDRKRIDVTESIVGFIDFVTKGRLRKLFWYLGIFRKR